MKMDLQCLPCQVQRQMSLLQEVEGDKVGYMREVLRVMADLPEEQAEQVIGDRPLKAYTGCTITDPLVLRHHLEEIRQNGYAVDNMEHEYGIRCVAVPVFNSAGQVTAAVSVSGPSLRFDPETIIRDAQIISGILQPLQRCI